ncbi:hypothetical protein HYY73_02165 [Candidatus Woesearchaeota archaeon]|nr:hypothetical protein [Candidatus Woesearchaeota archaeon]
MKTSKGNTGRGGIFKWLGSLRSGESQGGTMAIPGQNQQKEAIPTNLIPLQSAAAQETTNLTYPQKLENDVLEFMTGLFAEYETELQRDEALKEAYATANAAVVQSGQNVTNPPHARALAQLVLKTFGGLEGITITNDWRWESESSDKGKNYDNFKSRATFTLKSAPTVSEVRQYLTGLFGPEFLTSKSASDFNTLPLEERISLKNIKVLLPNLPANASHYVANLAYSVQGSEPFNSPYFIIMGMNPDARLLAARAMLVTYAKGGIMPHEILKTHMEEVVAADKDNQIKEPHVWQIADLDAANFAIPDDVMNAEAKRLGINKASVEECKSAYSAAWEHFRRNLDNRRSMKQWYKKPETPKSQPQTPPSGAQAPAIVG